MKKTWILILLLVLLATGVVGYYIYQRGTTSRFGNCIENNGITACPVK